VSKGVQIIYIHSSNVPKEALMRDYAKLLSGAIEQRDSWSQIAISCPWNVFNLDHFISIIYYGLL